jgi:multidrug resistance efflux pump
MADKEMQKRLRSLERQASDLRALVDTLQAALRRAESALEDTDEYDYVFAQSAKWAIKEKI